MKQRTSLLKMTRAELEADITRIQLDRKFTNPRDHEALARLGGREKLARYLLEKMDVKEAANA